MDISIKNVRISVIDNAFFNSVENLYWINIDFVRLFDKSQTEIDLNVF